ncbi:MAG: SLC13 family permease, partial [Chthoniobacteraceae bacterium]
GTFGGIAIGYPTFSDGLGFHTWFHVNVPLSVAFLSAAVITVLLRCITAEKAYEMMDWKLLILVGGMTAFGRAMEVTGAAAYLADHLVLWFSPFGPTAILGGFIGVTVLLTQPMSNAAAALVVLPVALQTANQLGANPRSFAIAIMLAASTSFIAPFEPSNILVYGPGKYRLMDFVRVGLGLTILLAIVVLIAEPYFFPLFPIDGKS